MSKVTVVLDKAEQRDLEQIVIDKDEAAALRFIREVRGCKRRGARDCAVTWRPGSVSGGIDE